MCKMYILYSKKNIHVDITRIGSNTINFVVYNSSLQLVGCDPILGRDKFSV